MPYDELIPRHSLTLEGRSRLSISGVEEVESFDENTIVMNTQLGALTIQGEDLHIEALSLEGGELRVQGEVDSLSYEAAAAPGGFFSRLFHP